MQFLRPLHRAGGVDDHRRGERCAGLAEPKRTRCATSLAHRGGVHTQTRARAVVVCAVGEPGAAPHTVRPLLRRPPLAQVVAGLTAYTFHATKRGVDFSFMGPMLWGCLWALIIW